MISDFNLSINFPEKDCLKLLSVRLYNSLRFSGPTKKIVRCLKMFCEDIYTVRHFFSRKCLLTVYIAYAQSKINYGIFTYGATSLTHPDEIVIGQNWTIGAIFITFKNDPVAKTNELYSYEIVKEIFFQMMEFSSITLIDVN